MVWPVPTVRALALSQSLPTANTHELLRVETSVAVGAPLAPLAALIAPMAPEPFEPDVSAPLTATTVMDAAADCANVAVMTELLRGDGENARQILRSRVEFRYAPPVAT